MRIKDIKIDEDVVRILNEQDNDDTSKYRVYSNDIKEAIELPMDIPNEPYIEVTLDYGRPLLGYRLIDEVLYYTGRNGTKQIGKNVTLDNLAKRILSHAKNITKMNIDKIEVDNKVIWDCADGFINESIKEDYPKDREELINKYKGVFKKNGITLEISNLYNKKEDNFSGGFGKSYNVEGKVFNRFEKAIEYMKKLSNKNESIKEEFIDEDITE